MSNEQHISNSATNQGAQGVFYETVTIYHAPSPAAAQVEATLQAYFDRMYHLMRHEGLNPEARRVTRAVRSHAHASTLSVLRSLPGPAGKRSVLRFLYESGLLGVPEPLVALDEADLRGIDVHGALLAAANLSGAALEGALLRGAVLTAADLHGATLHQADMQYADLRMAQLWVSALRGADLRGADLRSANMHGADLHGVNAHGADLRGADLSSATLDGAYLTGARLEGARYTTRPAAHPLVPGLSTPPTRWPAGFAPPATARDTSAR